LLFSYGNVIDTAINEKIITLHNLIAAQPFPGFIETVPAYASLAVFYDAVSIKHHHPTIARAFEFVKKNITKLAASITHTPTDKWAEETIIPVYYNGEDLDYIARVHQITTVEVIQLHTGVTYRVFMTGFLPGFAYMGTVNEKIITQRKEKPRLQVAAGSVGIAGAQTGIYPVASPGGWQLIGTTPLQLFNKEKENPCLLKAGDRVQFVSITKKEFEQGNGH
jgi:inhibitor of KinA